VRYRFVSAILVILGCPMLASCSGDAASSAPSTAAGALPAAETRSGASAGSVSATRKPLTSDACYGSSLGSGAFVAVPGGSNYAAGTDSSVLGGEGNAACDANAVVAGGYDNYIWSGNGTGAAQGFIGAGNNNHITGDAANAAIVTGDGNVLSAPGMYAAIVGGLSNTLSSGFGFIGAGIHNTASGEGAYIGAGGYNTASGEGAVVDGGYSSTAAGTFATVPGGYVNSAAGTYSFAAGARASAPYTGNFVWSDGSDGDTILTATKTYQFLARASGGFTLYTNSASTVGAQLAAGSGTWASLSDRNAKTAIVPLDDDAVLARVDALPISRWSYKSERGVRHVGPMAQDFYAAFKVGEDDRHITSIDEDGVALAAIKALHAENARLRRTTSAQTAGLRAEVAGLRAEVAALRALVEKRAIR
jgi:hypothetical protein